MAANPTSCILMSGTLLCVCWAALGDTPDAPYTVNLGQGNEDLEAQINAIPWTRHPDGSSYRVKDVSHIDFSGRDLRLAEIHLELNALCGANFENCRLDGSSLDETRFMSCSFRNASLRFCEMDVFSADPESYNDFTGADITGSWLQGFPSKSLEQTRNFPDRHGFWGG